MESDCGQGAQDHYIAVLVDGVLKTKMHNTDERTCTESQSAVARAVLIYSQTREWFVSLCAPMSSRHRIAGATPPNE